MKTPFSAPTISLGAVAVILLADCLCLAYIVAIVIRSVGAVAR